MDRAKFFFFAFFMASISAPLFGCGLEEFEKEWEKSQLPSPDRGLKLSQAEEKLRGLVKKQFPDWLSGQTLPELSCLTSKSLKKRLTEGLNADFYRQSLEILDQQGGPLAKKFVASIREKFGNDYLPGLRIFLEANPTDLPAGFNRSSSGVFFAINQIDPSIWFVYFIHELTHALDEDLSSAQAAFGRAAPLIPSTVAQFATGVPDVTVAAFAEALVWTDLRRGYLSEVFAWKSTFDILQELPPEIFRRTDSDFLTPAFGSRSTFSYSQLNALLLPRFDNPKEGLYKSQDFQNIIETQRIIASAALAADDWEFIKEKSRKSFAIILKN